MELISEKISNKTYSKLRAEGLKKLIYKKRTNLYIKFLKNFLVKKDKILDLACGYGRITIPLSKQAYDIEGLDLSQCLIQDAKIKSLKNASLLHDAGKIQVPSNLLKKQEPLTDKEFKLITKHPRKGVELIKNLEILIIFSCKN